MNSRNTKVMLPCTPSVLARSVAGTELRARATTVEGRDLNPILQDPGLAIHPPLLYLGYVGFSITFAHEGDAALHPQRVGAQRRRHRIAGEGDHGAEQHQDVTSDFSVQNVVENSHSMKPMIYKISGVWGNHEVTSRRPASPARAAQTGITIWTSDSARARARA
jgi:hypothetical protein